VHGVLEMIKLLSMAFPARLRDIFKIDTAVFIVHAFHRSMGLSLCFSARVATMARIAGDIIG
jgi:hypothetical protein